MENNAQDLMTRKRSSNKKFLWLMLIVIVLAVLAAGLIYALIKTDEKPTGQKEGAEKKTEETSWEEGGVAVGGKWADAEVVQINASTYRMYYSVEPEVPGNNLEIYSSISSDGANWQKEDGIRKTMATFPDIIKLPDGSWRMYFQNQQLIKSAVSSDGLNWQDEPEVRIGKDEAGYNLESVGAQGTVQLDDGTYIMVYRGIIPEPYQTTEKLPNQETHLYFWATSKDGLNFEKKGIAFDSRNDTLLGATDGAEWVSWDNGELRLYFWSYQGVYHLAYKNGIFSEPVFDFTNKAESANRFPENPPADPTLININGKWFMYYGQHTKGIYYATL